MDAESVQPPGPSSTGLIGPGRLVLVVGPSGAGKDTLIAGARKTLADEPDFVFARRVVTRPEGEFEQHDTLSAEAFIKAEAQGAFVLHWQAHGLSYGVPSAIAEDIRAGRTVIVNTSRRIVNQARRRFATVVVLEVTAPPEVLNARIAARGREAASGSRTDAARAVGFRPDISIMNDSAPDVGVERMMRFLRTP